MFALSINIVLRRIHLNHLSITFKAKHIAAISPFRLLKGTDNAFSTRFILEFFLGRALSIGWHKALEICQIISFIGRERVLLIRDALQAPKTPHRIPLASWQIVDLITHLRTSRTHSIVRLVALLWWLEWRRVLLFLPDLNTLARHLPNGNSRWNKGAIR